MSKPRATQGPALLWIGDSLAAIFMAASLAVAIASAAGGDRRTLGLAAGGLILAALLRALLQASTASVGEAVASQAKREWRRRVFSRVLVGAPASRRMLGETIADAVDRIEDLGGTHVRYRPLRRAAVFSPMIVAAAAAFASPIAAAILVATLLPFVLGMALAGTAASRAAARQLDALGRLSGLFVDRVRALPLIVAFDAQERISRHLGDATREVAQRTIELLRIAFVSSAIIEFFAALSVALVALYCGFNLLGILPFPVPETLSLGQALFVLVLAPEFYLPMRRLAAAYHDKQVGEAATERLEDLTPAGAPAAPKVLIADPPALRFERVIVDYGETAIGPFSFDIPAGTALALRGTTGVGKSSLLHALLGLAPIGGGRILVDGRDAREVMLAGHVGWAGQSIALVPGTLADNIALACPGAPAAAIETAAVRAGLGPMIAARGQGLALTLDHRGSGLSGGERRRIGIARVLLRDAPLWLLDEPTADLDAASAADIARILAQASQGRTVLMVTHSADLAAIAASEMVLA